MASDLDYNDLVALATNGAYSTTTRLSELSAVFLLSACWTLRNRYLWETPLTKIDDTEYQNILDMISVAESELMGNLIGSIIPSVAVMTDPQLQAMIGQLLPQADYPLLTPVVPASWLVGSDIQVPDMRAVGLFGAPTFPTLGLVAGNNTETLTIAEMPSHTHVQDPHSHTYDRALDVPLVATPGPEPVSFISNVPVSTTPTVATNQPEGGGGAHNNVPESLLLIWYLVVQ